MTDEEKTREQLIDEVRQLRRTLQELQSGPEPATRQPDASSTRTARGNVCLTDGSDIAWSSHDADLPIVDDVPDY